MWDFTNEAFVVGAGLVVGHLFIYGRKVKKNIKIKTSELVGDAMQIGAMFVGAMSFLRGMALIGLRPTDTWQTIMITIIFAMSFEAYFQKLRDAFQQRIALVAAVAMGKLPDDTLITVPSGDTVPEKVEVSLPPEKEDNASATGQTLRTAYRATTKEKLPPDIQKPIDDLEPFE